MNDHVLVWDLETVPDLPCVARVHGLDHDDIEACREALGDKFPKLPFHQIACIGALIAERREGVWTVLSLGAPHVGDRTEAEIIDSFVGRIAEYRPQMVTFKSSAEQVSAHGNEDHGLRDVDAGFVVAHQTSPACHPAEGSLRRPNGGAGLQSLF